ncbi:MAG: damage-inducible protein DinB [Cyclobacteriaceae bacterium]|nr:damage-inducible protein DinB [Cyclobacteriaceae bacterium]
MTSLFKDIFTYHHHFNQKLIEEFRMHGANLPDRSFPLFCHMLNAHQIWNARILKVEEYGVQQQHALEQCALIDETNYTTTLNILETIDPESVITYRTSKGQPFSNSVRDILFHAANHTTHHRGQIISDFRQAGIPPLVTDYIFYLRK